MSRIGTSLAAVAAVLASPAAADVHGFVVFAGTATYSYAFAGKDLRLAATGRRLDPKDHASCAGHLFGVESFSGDVYRLDPNLKEDRRAALGRPRELTRLLGCDGRRLYAFQDNTVFAFDAKLTPAGKVVLEPERRGDIVPSLAPDGFVTFEDRAYLLATNSGEVHALERAGPERLTAKRLPRDPAGGHLKALWVDPDGRTLNVLGERRDEERTPDLAPGEARLIDRQLVQTYALDELAKAPALTPIHEERRIHTPYPPDFLEGIERKNAQGIIIDYPPPERPEGRPTGVNILRLSATSPAYAIVVVRPTDGTDRGFDPQELAVLRGAGRIEPVERLREPKHGAFWFKHGTEIFIVRESLGRRGLDVQPREFLKLLDQAHAPDFGDEVLTY
jgi:hypothetical protein